MQQTQRRNSSKRVLVGSRPVTGLPKVQPTVRTNEGDSARPEALHRFLGPTSVPTLSCRCLASFRRSVRHLPLLSRSVACHGPQEWPRAHPGPVATRLHEREQCQARQSRCRLKRQRRAPPTATPSPPARPRVTSNVMSQNICLATKQTSQSCPSAGSGSETCRCPQTSQTLG